MKKKLFLGLPLVLFVIFLVLLFVLLFTPVFHGKYLCKKSNGETITFDFINDEVVSQKIVSHQIPQSRFFGYVVNNEEIYIGNGTESLVTPHAYAAKFVRKSVFRLEILDTDQNGNINKILVFNCNAAIGLFIFYCIVLTGCLAFISIYMIRTTKKTHKKIEELENQKKSLEDVLNNLKK